MWDYPMSFILLSTNVTFWGTFIQLGGLLGKGLGLGPGLDNNMIKVSQ